MTKWILFIYGKEKSTYKNKLMTQYINRIQGEKKNRIISMQKKQFDKNLTTFQDGTLNKLQTTNYTNINIRNAIMKRAQ